MFTRWQQFPRFWALQILGWLAYTGIVFVDVLPRFRDRAPVTYNAVFVSTLFTCSLFLRLLCRRMLRQNTPWPRAMFQAGMLSTLMGIPCGILAEWSWNLVRGNSVGLRLVFDAWGGMVYAAFVLIAWSALYLGIKHYEALQLAHERALQAEALAREARLQALRYQLNPHFLFNALNAISTMVVRGEPTRATRMLSQLAGFLRSTLDGLGSQEIHLKREIANLEQYLEIEKARLGDRLHLEFLVDPAVENALVPALLLQPLAENAIRHGIAPHPQGGKLAITAERVGNRLRLVVTDDGAGAPSAADRSGLQRRGIGLSNTIERLRVLYGSDQRLIVRWGAEGGCQIEIEFPCKTEQTRAVVAEGEKVCAS